jgi:hypothetical protein
MQYESLTPSTDTHHRHTSATAYVCETDSCLGALGKPFIHFFFVGEQLFDAWALLHALVMRRDVGEAGDVHLQLGGAAAAPKEMRVRGGEMIEEVLTPGKQIVAELKIL